MYYKLKMQYKSGVFDEEMYYKTGKMYYKTENVVQKMGQNG